MFTEQIKESKLNRILSHMKNKDIATITAFRTDPELKFSKKINRERNRKLESELKDLGYAGFIKILGYWDETPDDTNSKPIVEESYIVLNTGSKFVDFATDMILLCKDVDNKNYDQQAVMIWDHESEKAYLYDNQGNILSTFNNFVLDNVSQAWSQIDKHKLTFVEESVSENYSEVFNHNGNWLTAMGIENNKNKFRSNKFE